MTARVILVGQEPPRSAPPNHRPLRGDSGERLARLAGVTLEDLLRLDRANLLGSYREKWGPADRAQAVRHVRKMLRSAAWDTHVMLGDQVRKTYASALNPRISEQVVRRLTPLESCDVNYKGGDLTRLVYVPHPSGRCRYWNEPIHRLAARSLLRGLLGLPEEGT